MYISLCYVPLLSLLQNQVTPLTLLFNQPSLPPHITREKKKQKRNKLNPSKIPAQVVLKIEKKQLLDIDKQIPQK